jgi:hypothetical protein
MDCLHKRMFPRSHQSEKDFPSDFAKKKKRTQTGSEGKCNEAHGLRTRQEQVKNCSSTQFLVQGPEVCKRKEGGQVSVGKRLTNTLLYRILNYPLKPPSLTCF